MTLYIPICYEEAEDPTIPRGDSFVSWRMVNQRKITPALMTFSVLSSACQTKPGEQEWRSNLANETVDLISKAMKSE
ncbi:hypothetical protein RRG08_016245 [Elysia crispata]|uniref:Uncharacterized protein n=1 Tax=Elysia crispata TaxID=231223 RepID=A0AAE0ZIT6_9GAST|nr:hypothetical protein RRG08_016245 [Elysia crispata]